MPPYEFPSVFRLPTGVFNAYYLLFHILSADPVIQELSFRLVTQRRVQPLPLVEHLDVIEACSGYLAARRDADVMHTLALALG